MLTEQMADIRLRALEKWNRRMIFSVTLLPSDCGAIKVSSVEWEKRESNVRVNYIITYIFFKHKWYSLSLSLPLPLFISLSHCDILLSSVQSMALRETFSSGSPTMSPSRKASD